MLQKKLAYSKDGAFEMCKCSMTISANWPKKLSSMVTRLNIETMSRVLKVMVSPGGAPKAFSGNLYTMLLNSRENFSHLHNSSLYIMHNECKTL